MTRGVAYRDDISNRPSRRPGWPIVPRRAVILHLAAQMVLVLVLVAAPWLLGGVSATAQLLLYGGLLASLGLWLMGYLFEPATAPDRTRMPLLIVPLMLAVVGGTLQLIPLPDGFDRWIGPEAVGSSVSGESESGGIPRVAASVYPAATRLQLARLSFVLVALFLGAQLFVTHRAQVCLFGALAIAGLAFSVFGIVQQLSWNGRLYWIGPAIVDGKPFAAFVNRNNAAGYLNLTFAAAIGFLIWASQRRTNGEEWRYGQLSDGLSTGIRQYVDSLVYRLGQITPLQTLSGACVVLIAAGVVSSASRGGVVALGLAALAVIVSLIRRGARSVGIGLGVLLAGVAAVLILWLGTPGQIGQRFAELSNDLSATGGRVENWKDTLAAVPEIWGTGSGLGTYQYFHRPYQRHPSEGVYVHAENQYVEALIEGGVGGLFLILAALVLGFLVVARLRRSTLIDPADGVAYVGLFVLVSQSFHALLDFGLTQPANALTFAVLMGSVGGRAVRKLGNGSGQWAFALPSVKPRAAFAILGGILFFNGLLGWWEFETAGRAERVLTAARRAETGETTRSNSELLADLLAAAASRSDDARLQLEVGRCYIRMYEAEIQTQLRNVSPTETDQQLERMAALSTLYRRANEFVRAGLPGDLRSLRDDDLVQRTLVPARSALLASRSACGLLPQVELLLAQLAFLGGGAVDGREHLERTRYLAPYDAGLQYAVGALAIDAGQFDLTLEAWRQAFALHHRDRYRILQQLTPLLTPDQLIESALPDDPGVWRAALLDRMFQTTFPDLITRLAERLDQRYRSGEAPSSVSDRNFLKGFRAWVNGDLAAARESLQSVLSEQPDDTVAKVYLIEVLISSGDLDRADTLLSDQAIPQKLPGEFKRLEFQLATARAQRENGTQPNWRELTPRVRPN